jgi:acyl transferase domain-containing protein
MVGLQVALASRVPGGAFAPSPATPPAAAEQPGDAITHVPFSRWDIEAARAGRPALGARFGGCLAVVDAFDTALFGVSAPEAQLMDPQQRLLLEARAGRGRTILGLGYGIGPTPFARTRGCAASGW